MIHHTFKISKYNTYTLEDRAKYAWIYGRLLCSCQEGTTCYYLYALSNFYVEIVFDDAKQEILDIQAINRNEGLSKYVGDISLESLF